MGRREEKQQELTKRLNAPLKEVDPLKLLSSYKKKAVTKMKRFYVESTKMDSKLPRLLEATRAAGLIIDKIVINSYEEECLLNYRKKTRALTFQVEAHRDHYTFNGALTVTPASMKLILNSPELNSIRTKTGFSLPHFQASYYRTLVIKDNYLPAIIAGRNPYYTTATSTNDLVELDF